MTKKKRMKKLFLLLMCTLVVTSCTDNERARHWGGTETVKLKPNEILVNMTWKDTELWILTKDTTKNIYIFREKSSWGVMEGAIYVQ